MDEGVWEVEGVGVWEYGRRGEGFLVVSSFVHRRPPL